MNAEDVCRLMDLLDLLRAEGDDEFAHRVLDGVATKRSNEVLLEKLRVAEAIRDDARLASMNDIEAKRLAESATAKFTAASLTAAWGNGVQACIDKVKQRQEHYELYRCDCLDRDPGNGHAPGCKGEAMATHPATFAILDEVLVFLSALQERGASK
jgi:hypothetical protein